MQSPIVLLSWVFAKPELYLPFREHFEPNADVYQLYLVATEAAIAKRLTSRKDEALLKYSLGKLHLINALPFKKFDTTEKDVLEIGQEILQFLDGLHKNDNNLG